MSNRKYADELAESRIKRALADLDTFPTDIFVGESGTSTAFAIVEFNTCVTTSELDTLRELGWVISSISKPTGLNLVTAVHFHRSRR